MRLNTASQRWISGLVCAAALSLSTAHAAPPSAASVEQLVQLNGAQKALEQATANMQNQIRQQVQFSLQQQNGGQPLSALQQAAVDKVVPGVVAVLRDELSWAKLKPGYVRLYQEQLTQTEVDRLIALYQDPAYVQLMQTMQGLNQRSAQMITERMPAIVQRITPVIERSLRQVLGQ
jgi:hypothetical protein